MLDCGWWSVFEYGLFMTELHHMFEAPLRPCWSRPGRAAHTASCLRAADALDLIRARPYQLGPGERPCPRMQCALLLYAIQHGWGHTLSQAYHPLTGASTHTQPQWMLHYAVSPCRCSTPCTGPLSISIKRIAAAVRKAALMRAAAAAQ